MTNDEIQKMRLAVMVARVPFEEEAAGSDTVKAGAEELGIPLEKYDYRVHWPILLARRCREFADRFVGEIERLEKPHD